MSEILDMTRRRLEADAFVSQVRIVIYNSEGETLETFNSTRALRNALGAGLVLHRGDLIACLGREV
jgi:hypothetical protein